MANNEATITVALERAVHEGLQKVVERIYEKHALRVIEMRIVWSDISTAKKESFRVVQVEVTTSSSGAQS